mgnify:CR=1 FL=1
MPICAHSDRVGMEAEGGEGQADEVVEEPRSKL